MEIPLSSYEAGIVANFMGTLADQTLSEALLNAELEVTRCGLSYSAARELGFRIRTLFASQEAEAGIQRLMKQYSW
jgi:hypothetical protein